MALTASQQRALEKNMEYWREREEAAKEHYIAEDNAIEAKIASKYNYLYLELDERINAFYSRYAGAEGIDMATAQQRVSRLDIKAFEERAKQYVEAAARMRQAIEDGHYALAEQLKKFVFSDEANEAMRIYNATMKINRLEMLKAQMGLDITETFNEIQQIMGDGLDARVIEEFARQAGILGETIRPTTGKVNAIVNASFNNATWSQRLWGYQDQLRAELSQLLTNGIIQGRNAIELARELRKTMGGTKADTERLLRTEMARVQTDAQMDSYIDNGYDEYVFIAAFDACPICKELDGQVFRVMDPKSQEPPVHPNCRCSTAAYMSREELEKELFGEEEDDTKAKVRSEGVAPEYVRNPTIDKFETEEEIKKFFPEIQFYKNFSNLSLETQKEVAQGFDYMRNRFGEKAMPKTCGASEKEDYGKTIPSLGKVNLLKNLEPGDGFSTACHECIHVFDYNKGLLSFRMYDKINKKLNAQGYNQKQIDRLKLDVLGVDLYPKYYADTSELLAYSFEEVLYGSTNAFARTMVNEL